MVIHPLPAQFEELPDGGGTFSLLAKGCEIVKAQQC